jgi:hypothetical protein
MIEFYKSKLLCKIIIINIFIIYSAQAQPVIEEFYQVRAQSFSAYHVSRDLLDRVNRTESINLRTQLASEVGKGTGRQIQSTWIYRANEYMSQINNRAHMDPDLVQTNTVVTPTKPLIEKPLPPNRSSFNTNIESIKAEMIKENKAIIKGFNKSSAPLIEKMISGDNYQSNRKLFEQNGLGSLFDEMVELADGGFSSPKLSRNVIKQLADNKRVLATLNSDSRSLANRAGVTSTERNNNISKHERDIEKRTQFFKDVEAEYPQKLNDYEKKISAQTTEEVKPRSVGAEQQLKLDEEFFKSKNMNPVTSLNELTQQERILLLNHSSKPLSSNDPSKGMDIINAERKRQKDFVLQIRDTSNEVSKAAIENRAPRNLKGPLQIEAQKLTNTAIKQDTASKYKALASSRLTSNKHKYSVDSMGVVNNKSRLALLDTMSGGSINPYEGFNTRSGLKNLDIKTALDKIPANDSTGKKAFIKYVLEHGSPEQMRSLKIHAHHLVIQVESNKAFMARCKKGAPKW